MSLAFRSSMKKPGLLTLGDFKRKILKSHGLEILSEVAAVYAEQAAKEEISTSAAAAAADDVITSKKVRKSTTKNKMETLRKKNGEKKKKIDFGPNPPPDLPASFFNKIRHMDGNDIVRVIQKPLYKSDVCKGECRFSIPLKQVQQEFLTEQEKVLLSTYDPINNKLLRIEEITLIDPSLNEKNISLGKWKMPKKHGPSSESYVLVNKWTEIVEENQLMKGDIVQLWAFRVAAASLCFALVVVKRYDQDIS